MASLASSKGFRRLTLWYVIIWALFIGTFALVLIAGGSPVRFVILAAAGVNVVAFYLQRRHASSAG